ncbi:MAG: phosphoribosylpyrophosphate synthetase [Lewinellaceae bacterium]|nr:phosphoribosylpyrophosphate synthetase [Saprospiraceae bacterium]MCB9341704.1 phosphoribosylpyrophosphate synthetase [Lewinellaceae bacterium]
MRDYQNLVEALNDLKARGYENDFNLKPFCVECASLQLQLHPEDFEIKETYRFEGMSNPDDSSVVYAIESLSGIKGVMVDAYGVYAEALTPEMATKLGNTNAKQ